MKTILILISLILLISCRTKHKMLTTHKEKKEETQKTKVDSLELQNLKLIQKTSYNSVENEEKNEVSGEMLITGKSDVFNPFIFHNVIGNDTIQSISIVGNAEYSISNHFLKTDNKKIGVIKDEETRVVQKSARKSGSKEIVKESNSEVFEKTNEIKAKGFQAGTWIAISIIAIILILTFFTYKYFKK